MEKGSDWYWAVGIVSISLSATSIILNNVLFGILILVAAFGLILFASRRPLTINVEINEAGIKIEKYFYPFSVLESFCVDETGLYPKILLKSHKFFSPLIIVPIAEVSPNKIKSLLLVHLAEEKLQEPLSQKILEYLGF